MSYHVSYWLVFVCVHNGVTLNCVFSNDGTSLGFKASVITANRDLIFFHFAFDCLLTLNISRCGKK